MFTKKDVETSSSVKLSFLVHKPSGSFFSYTQSFKQPICAELFSFLK